LADPSQARTRIKAHDEGAQSEGAFFAAAGEMARRLDAGGDAPSDAVLSFESLETMLRVLSPNRLRLVGELRRSGPTSIRALAKALGRDYRAVHVDVGALLAAGLIERDAQRKLTAPYARIAAEMNFDAAA